jgi:hypothetical protein
MCCIDDDKWHDALALELPPIFEPLVANSFLFGLSSNLIKSQIWPRLATCVGDDVDFVVVAHVCVVCKSWKLWADTTEEVRRLKDYANFQSGGWKEEVDNFAWKNCDFDSLPWEDEDNIDDWYANEW